MTSGGRAQSLRESARRILLHEVGHRGGAEAWGAAAQAVHDKLSARLVPILGSGSVQLLFARSVRLAQAECAGLARKAATAGTDVGALLRDLAPEVARQGAEALFGTFLEVLGSLIGERLTLQILKSAWPMIVEEAS